MQIALVTYLDKGAFASPTLENEDDTLLNFLIKKGLNVEKIIWNDPNIDWKAYDLVILKSPWDYFDLIDSFYKWLAMLQKEGVRLLNPIATVKWNADKHYLHEIAKTGLKVVKSIFITKGEQVDLSNYFKVFDAEKFIVKPCVSGGSKNTFKVNLENVKEISEKINLLLTEEDFILQPFVKEIEEDGEWSFVFFNGQFSHALLKKAKPGDFRVQHSFGGTIHPQQPAANLVASAQKYVNVFAKNCLYARVDAALIQQELVLMELELIEPFLFLNTNVNALANYYEALTAFIK